MIVLVLGGTRSGKSEVAERLASTLPQPVTYVATGAPVDDEMAARIAAHKLRRPVEWSTVEVAANTASAASTLPDALRRLQGTVLVDALGTWLAGLDDFAADEADVAAALQGRDGDAVVVSDEVGLGVHPSTEVGRRFRDRLGEVNRSVADVADRVLLVVAGRTLELDR
ncbi:MAG: adenosylcobinamide kinase / adenosylcobinamide-phosphate guanylyltransferase [Acidimicrobiaceae bacterium]|nr:adenosylcobinamide kinase / adenosylcobinamide-phosphate guanylyltransferase [Acidimicrobiaceae bacterium]